MSNIMKQKINNIASVGIIYRASNPEEVLLEIKDEGYPVPQFRNTLCPIGGNWIGEAAKKDKNTRETFEREVEEEFSLHDQKANTEELVLLGLVEKAHEYTPKRHTAAESGDEKILEDIKQLIKTSATPFGDFLNSAEQSVYAVEGEQAFAALVSYWLVALPDESWKKLRQLQAVYGNLSNESITLMTSLPVIIDKDIRFAFGHDNVLKKFFLDHGVAGAETMPVVHGFTSIAVGMPLASYEEYFAQYEVMRKPIEY